MKHFITFIAFIIALTLTSFTAQAQYHTPRPVTFSTSLTDYSPESFLELSGYESAQKRATKASYTLWAGIGSMTIGGILLAIPTIKHDAWYEDGAMYEYISSSGEGLHIVGAIFSIAGAITASIGGVKYAEAKQDMRDIRFAWYITHNGIAVAF